MCFSPVVAQNDHAVTLRKMENARFILGTFYSVTDEYDDFNYLGADLSPTTFPATDPIHLLVSDAFEQLHIKSYYRHVKSHAFKRVPWCNNNEEYYNLDWQYSPTNTSQCEVPPLFNGPAFVPDYIKPVIDDAQNHGQTIGLYHQSFSDFFFEIQHPTGTPLLSTGEDVIISPSPCLCRQFNVGEFLEDGTFSDDYPNILWSNEPLNYPFDGVFANNDALENGAYLYGTPSGGAYHDHILCVNCDRWRIATTQRISYLASQHPHAIFFDVRHMPEEGCWCHNCRDLYASSPEFCADTYNACYEAYIAGGERERMADFMNFSLVEYFRDLRQTMHGFGVLGTVSVEDLPALNKDDHRTELVRNIDLPKTEFTIPIKKNNNRIFWGSPFVPGNTNYYSLLSQVNIPEVIREASGFEVMRDASPNKLGFAWVSGQDFPLNFQGSVNNSVKNNQRIKSLLGIGYACGVFSSITVGNPFLLSANNQINWTGNTSERMWSFSNSTLLQNTPQAAAQITSIFDMDNLISNYLQGKRPYTWTGLLFSEVERNHYLYLTTAQGYATPLPTEITLEVNTPNSLAYREALAWTNHLLPTLAAYQSLKSSPIDADGLSYKFPVSFVNDNDLEEYQVSQENLDIEAIIAAHPATPLVLQQATQTGLDNLVNLGVELIQAPASGVLFHEDFETDHNTYCDDIRQQVIGTIGLPDIYAVGIGEITEQVIAGFFSDDKNEEISVVLSAQGTWGIPKEDVANFDPNPVEQYGIEPVTIPNGRMIIHIRADGVFVPDGNCSYDIIAATADLQTFIPYWYFDSDADEYIIIVPEFQHFILVNIAICAE